MAQLVLVYLILFLIYFREKSRHALILDVETFLQLVAKMYALIHLQQKLLRRAHRHPDVVVLSGIYAINQMKVERAA